MKLFTNVLRKINHAMNDDKGKIDALKMKNMY